MPAGTPTVVRRVKGRLEVRVPYRRGGWRDMWNDAGLRPVYDKPSGCWLLARTRFNDVIAALLAAGFGQVQLEIWGNEADRCDERCQGAKGTECVCSCAGQHHGGGLLGVPVGDTMRIVHQGLVCQRYLVHR